LATQPTQTPLQIAVANNAAESFARLQDQILPETWELNRWLLASLLAVNSAGAATIYTANSVGGDAKLFACRAFIAGAIAALGSGFVQMMHLPKLSAVATDAQSYWAAVAGGAARSLEKEAQHEVGAKLRFGWLPQALLMSSAALFCIGLLRL